MNRRSSAAEGLPRQRLSILWLSHLVPYPPHGGVLQRSFNLLRRVAERHDVHLLAFNQRALLPDATALSEALDQLRRICASVDACRIPADDRPLGRKRLYVRSLFSRRPFTARWLRSSEMELRIRELLRRRRIDLVHLDTISLAPFASVFQDCPRVLNHHNIESHMMRRRAAREPNPLAKGYMALEAWKLRRFEVAMCSGFDLNLTCSRLDSTRLLHEVPKAVVDEIPNGVDLAFFQPLDLPEEEQSLIWVGGMGWYPNRRAMLYFSREVWPTLKREVPSVRMTIVGKAPPGELVRLGLRDPSLRVTGFIPDIRPLLAQAQVYICPIRDGGGTRLKVLDALAMGKALVAHPIAVEGIDVESGKHFIAAQTPREFVDAIKLLFDKPELRLKLGTEGRRFVEERYDFDLIGAKLNRLYEQIASRRCNRQ